MLNKISDNSFKQTLQQLEKQKNKKRDFNNVFQMYVDVSSDIFRQIIICYQENNINTRSYPNDGLEVIKNCFNENIIIFDNLKTYFNEQLKKCGKSYKCVYPGISENYNWEFNYERYIQRLRRDREIQPEVVVF